MEEMIKIISNLGFPIFVAVWMLMKGSEDSKKLQQSIDNQAQMTHSLKEAVESLKDHCMSRGQGK